MRQLLLMVIVAVAVHLLLVWTLLAGIVITAAVPTVPGLIKLFAQLNDENRFAVFGIALQAIGGTLIADYLVRGGGSRSILRGTSELVNADIVLQNG